MATRCACWVDRLRALPQGLTAYRQTPEFTEQTVPAGLLRDHSTKVGVWGLIHVTAGELIYRLTASGEELRLAPTSPPAVIEPEALHSVELAGAVTFYVEFWR